MSANQCPCAKRKVFGVLRDLCDNRELRSLGSGDPDVNRELRLGFYLEAFLFSWTGLSAGHTGWCSYAAGNGPAFACWSHRSRADGFVSARLQKPSWQHGSFPGHFPSVPGVGRPLAAVEQPLINRRMLMLLRDPRSVPVNACFFSFFFHRTIFTRDT